MKIRDVVNHFFITSADQDDRFRIAYFLSRIVLAVLVLCIPATLFFVYVVPKPAASLSNSGLMVVLILAFIAFRRGLVKETCLFLVIAGWVYITVSLFFLGGLSSPNITFYLLLLILGGYTLGIRGLLLSGGLSLAGILMVFAAQSANFIRPDPDIAIPSTLLIVYVSVLLVVGGLVYISTISLQGAVRQADAMILERQQYAESLARSEEKFRAVIEHSPMGIFLLRQTSDQGLVLSGSNPAAKEILKVDFPFGVDEPLAKNFPGIADSGLLGAFESVLQTGEPLYEPAFRYNDPVVNGAFEIRAFRTLPDSMAVMFFEISDRLSVQESLQESESTLRVFIDALSEPAMLVDLEGNILLWNNAFQETFHLLPKQIQKVNVLNLFDPERYERRKSILAEVVRSKQPLSFEEKGSGRVILVRVYPIIGAKEEVERLAVVSFDITEREKTEKRLIEQVQRMAALRSIDTAINSSLDLRATLNVFLNHVLSELKADGAMVLLYNPVTYQLDFGAVNGFQSSKFRVYHVKLGEGPAGQAALRREIITQNNLGAGTPPFAHLNLLCEENINTCISSPLISKGELKGVLEIYFRSLVKVTPDWLDFLETLSGQAAIAIDNMSLFNNLQRSHNELALAYDATLQGWMHALDLRDHETEGHTQRVTNLMVRMAHQLGVEQEKIVHMRRGAILHDIGKIGIPDQILLKPGPLSPEEWEEMKKHVTYSRDLLLSIPYLKPALDIPYCHHEKWDGTGYPRGLKGESIPLAARIFALIDVWDALTNDRPYHPAFPVDYARQYILEQAGKQFDPKLVSAFLDMVSQEGEG